MTAVFWIPLQASFIRLIADAAEWMLTLFEHPPIVTGLTSSGNILTIHSYVTGAPTALTRLHCDPFHITVVLCLALVMSVPHGGWRPRFVACLTSLLVMLAVMAAACAVQVQIAAENYSLSHFNLALYSASERQFSDWALRKSSLLTVYVIPASLFLSYYLSSHSSPSRSANGHDGTKSPGIRRRPVYALASLAALACLLILVSSTPGSLDVLHIPGLRKIARLNPASARAQFNLAVNLEKAGSFDEALIYYAKTLRLDPEHVGAYLGAGNVHYQRAEFIRASRSYLEALKRNPEDTAALFNLANSCMRSDAPGRAALLYKKVLSLDPGHAAAHLGFAKALTRTGRPCDALPHLERASMLDSRLRADGALNQVIRSFGAHCASRQPGHGGAARRPNRRRDSNHG